MEKDLNYFFKEYEKTHDCPSYMKSGFETINNIGYCECDSLLSYETKNGYELLYLYSDIIIAKVTYNKDYMLDNKNGPSVSINNVSFTSRNRTSVYNKCKKVLFFKDNDLVYSGHAEDPYIYEIWNRKFSKVINRINNIEKLKKCKKISEAMGMSDYVATLNAKIVANSLTN